MRRTREWLANAAVSVGSIVVFLALCEFVVFRAIWPASDVPANAFVDGLVRFVPNQTGVWRVRNEIAARYVINAQGWNSGSGDYATVRREGVERIAVVGDSFVESLQVAHDRSFADVLARERGGAEALRFGISGAPMSGYLHMTEQEVAKYSPDWLVVVLVHNDFDESFRFKQGRYTSSFRKLIVENGRVVGETGPEPWRPGPVEWLRRTATARFFLYRWQVRPQALVDLLLPAARAGGRFEANIVVGDVLAQEGNVRAATDYVMSRLAARAKDTRTRLLILMDGDRAAIYARRRESEPLRLNRIAAEMAARHGIAFLDLHPVFAADWQANGQRFEFASDAHWNEHGHSVVAHAVAAAMREMMDLSRGRGN
jgi:hypothetical protein